MILDILKGIFLSLGTLFILYALVSLAAGKQVSNTYEHRRQNGSASLFLAVVVLMIVVYVLLWPIQRLLRKEKAWWARGWGWLIGFAFLGGCFFLTGWFL